MNVLCRSARRSPLALAAGVLLTALLGAGCNDYVPAVYTAQLYNAADDCLEPYAPVGVVQVKDISSLCPPTCLFDSSGTLYVSTVCAPYPDAFSADLPSDDSVDDCNKALAAAAADQQCGADAGS